MVNKNVGNDFTTVMNNVDTLLFSWNYLALVEHVRWR